MKKTYETPSVEVVKFQYRDQVVVASAGTCQSVWVNTGDSACTNGDNKHQEFLN